MKHTPSSVVGADCDVIGKEIRNNAYEHLGKIKEVMLDKISGRVAYVVLDSGSFLGIGGKYFALPWNSLRYDDDKNCFIVDINKERLSNAPGFDKDHWPDMSDKNFGKTVSTYYGTKPYWE